MSCRQLYPFIFFIAFCIVYSPAQNKKKLKEIKQISRDAQSFFDLDDYPKAFILYKQVLALDPQNERAGVNTAICINKLAYSQDSAYFLISNLSNSKQIDSKYYLAKIKHSQGKFDESIALLQQYNLIAPLKRLNSTIETDYLIGINLNAKKYISKPNQALIKNMGPAINSKFDDYAPVIIPDESALYFTSKREGNFEYRKNSDNNYFEDVYVSFKENEQWQSAQNVGEPINSATNDACVAISSDGQRMIVYRTAENLISGDLYTTQLRSNNKWESLKLLPLELNSPNIESSACFSNDTNEIYFSSNRSGGYGGKDLYRLKKLPNQKWSAPYNLGPNINTPYDEDAPFMHPDGKTLYFSSCGHSSMGNYDVFVSELEPINNQFSFSENLGYPINDINNDIFFVLSVDGQRGYYSSVKSENYGGTDVYQIDTRFKERDLVVKRGKILLDTLPLRGKITLYDKSNNELNGTYTSHPSSGNFIMVLNPYKSYRAVVEAEACQDLEFEIHAIVSQKRNDDLILSLKKSNAQ